MSVKEEKPNVIDLEGDIDSMVSVIQSEAPPAPDIKEITKSEENPRESKEFARNSMTSALLVSNFGIAELTLGRRTIALSCDIKDLASIDIFQYRKFNLWAALRHLFLLPLQSHSSEDH